jgi:hypothetical protein
MLTGANGTSSIRADGMSRVFRKLGGFESLTVDFLRGQSIFDSWMVEVSIAFQWHLNFSMCSHQCVFSESE